MMPTQSLLEFLWLATWTGSLAIVIVLLLRSPVRRRFGAGIAYALWALPLVTWLALWLPARVIETPAQASASVIEPAMVSMTVAAPTSSFDTGLWWLAAWWSGVGMMIVLLLWQQRRFIRALGRMQLLEGEYGTWQAEASVGLPAVVGLLRPRIILPADIDMRFDDEQRGLMLAHERIHLRRGDAWANAIAAMARCVFWFNPLVHVAASRMRHDQELACDARVITLYPHARRAYGEAMLKNATSSLTAPLGCHWGITHPMKERVMLLKNAVPTRTTRVTGALLVGMVAVIAAAAAWAALPPRQVERTSEVDVRSEGRDYQAQIGISVDGSETNDITLVGGYGKPFKVRIDDSKSGAYDLEGTVMPVAGKDGAPAYRIATQLRRAGKLIGDPVLVVDAGRQARIKLGDEASGGFSGIEMDMRINDVDATTAQALDTAVAARAEAEHAMALAGHDHAMAAADAAQAANDARIAADEAVKAAAEARQETAQRSEQVLIERRVIRTAGSPPLPAPPMPPLPPTVNGAPRIPPAPSAPSAMNAPPAPPVPAMPAVASGNAKVRIERHVRNGAAPAAPTTNIKVASFNQAVAAGGRELSAEQAAGLGLNEGYRWVDVQSLVNDKASTSLEIVSEIVVTDKDGKAPRYVGYQR